MNPTISNFSASLNTQILQATLCKPIEQNERGSISHFGFYGSGRYKRPDLLWDDFLSVGSDEGEAKKFHKKWGLLKICSCGRNIGACDHSTCRAQYFHSDHTFRATFEEPYSRVCRLSTCFGALLRIKDSIDRAEQSTSNRQDVGSHEDWLALDFDPKIRHVTLGGQEANKDVRFGFLRLPSSKRIEMARIKVNQAMFDWLNRSQLSLSFKWVVGSPTIGVTDQSFLSAFPQLVMCLTVAMSRSGKIAICSNCHDPYEINRSPKPNTFNVCDKYDCKAEQNRRNVTKYRRGEAKKKTRPGA